MSKDFNPGSAAKALQRWFQSQELSPAEAGLTMARLQAIILVHKTTNVKSLTEALLLHNVLLTLEVSAAREVALEAKQ